MRQREESSQRNINPLKYKRLVDEQPNFICFERRGRIFARTLEEKPCDVFERAKKLFSSISSSFPAETEKGKLNASTHNNKSSFEREIQINPRSYQLISIVT
jgi:hypothetical protein